MSPLGERVEDDRRAEALRDVDGDPDLREPRAHHLDEDVLLGEGLRADAHAG